MSPEMLTVTNCEMKNKALLLTIGLLVLATFYPLEEKMCIGTHAANNDCNQTKFDGASARAVHSASIYRPDSAHFQVGHTYYYHPFLIATARCQEMTAFNERVTTVIEPWIVRVLPAFHMLRDSPGPLRGKDSFKAFR
jgi:hypothetical protein